MEFLFGAIMLIFIFATIILAIYGFFHLTELWDVIDRYYIKKECRHEFGKWTTPTNNGSQIRECQKCGWVERNYR